MPLPGWAKPAIGMTALGLIAVVFPQALGMGYGYVQQAIDGSLTIQFLLLFAAIKIVATSLTISSGGKTFHTTGWKIGWMSGFFQHSIG